MPRWLQWVLGSALALFIIGGPLGYAQYRKATFRNFRVVRGGVLYRSGQLSLDGLKRAIHDYGLKTVITFRDPKVPGGPQPNVAEERYCLDQELYYYRLGHRALARDGSIWIKVKGAAPVDANVAQFLEIMDDPKHYPVLVHCLAGTHRTGAYVAIYRMEYQRWSNEAVIAELKATGYDDIEEHDDILGYLQAYVPRWKRAELKGER